MSGDVIFGPDDQTGPDNENAHDVAETSKEQYQSLKETGELGDQCRQVLKALNEWHEELTIDELANGPLAGWQKSTVSGRLNDLKDMDFAEDLDGEDKRKSKFSGIKSKVWEITPLGKKKLERLEK